MRFAAVIPAAGESRRMGARNKLLLPLQGKPLAAHALAAVLAADVDEVCVVLGHEADAVRAAMDPGAGGAVRFAVNPDYRKGLASSLICGLSALPPFDGVLICLADMPGITPDLINSLRTAYRDGDYAVVPVWDGQWGNPVLLSARAAVDARRLTGDKGARVLLKAHAQSVREVPAPTDAVLRDLDRPQDVITLNAGPGGNT